MITKNNDGFISIIAIGVFALLMIFAIALQMTVIDTLQNLRNGVNYDAARDSADSTIEYLQKKMQSFSPGLNATVKCIFANGATDNASTDTSVVCPDVLKIIGSKKATVDISVKGRTIDKLTSGACGIGDCYVTPIPGTGNAGKNCAMYTPNSTGSVNIDNTLNNGSNVDQVNYSCNWNKLVFGGSQTDRVAIPLFYDSSILSDQPNQASKIVNPYQNNNAPKFYVRLRTPCVPCGQKLDSGQVRDCTNVKDETVCTDATERYVLDATNVTSPDDIVVQWSINGMCGNEACGVLPIPQKATDKSNQPLDASALYESLINKVQTKTMVSQFDVIDMKSLAYDSNDYPSPIYLLQILKNNLSSVIKLPLISKPVLTLFLSKPLLTKDKANIPYLEYQVLTDKPIGNSKSSLDVTVNVEGNTFRKTLTQEVQKALIDFAIHN